MKRFALPASAAAFSLALFTAACMSDSGGDDPPPVTPGGPGAHGIFRVTMTGPNFLQPAGVSSIGGGVYDTAQPQVFHYRESAKKGACILLEAETPRCSPACSTDETCVFTTGASAKCQKQATRIGVGEVTATGLKDREGKTSFVMTPSTTSQKDYFGPTLVFPPCDAGADVAISAAGSAEAGPFSATAKCIAPLVVAAGDVKLEDGKPLVLEWTPSTTAGSMVSVVVNIDNHGGNRGKITCETADNGRLEIDATLGEGLKEFGISGFPTVDLTRYAKGTSAQAKVDLVIEQKVTKELIVPGIISCDPDDPAGCPDGKACTEARICE